MKTTGIQILTFLSEQLGIDVSSPRFSYDQLTDVQKDTVVRWLMANEPADHIGEIVPGAAEWGGRLTHLWLSDPLKYMERLRALLTRDCASSQEMEERLQTEATIREGISSFSLRVQLWNDQWDFYRNVSYAAINYLNGCIDKAVRSERALHLQQSA